MNPIWHREVNGNLVNLAHCSMIELARVGSGDDAKWEIRARLHGSDSTFWVLFRSSDKAPAQEQMQQLMKQVCASY